MTTKPKQVSQTRKEYLANVSNILTPERTAYLNDLYYVKGYVLGRDSLFEIAKKERDNFATQNRITDPTDKRLNKFPTKRAIGEFLGNQELQQLYRGQRKPNDIKGLPLLRPGKHLAIDLIDFSKGTNKGRGDMWYIFTCIDIFSRYLFAEPIFRKEPQYTAMALEKILVKARKEFNVDNPDWILSDRGDEFKGVFKKYVEKEGITRKLTLAGAPASNGVVERANGKIKVIMTKRKELFGKNWVDDLQPSVKVFNGQFNRYIQSFPYEAAKLRLPADKTEVQRIRDAYKEARSKNINTQGIDQFNSLVEKLPIDILDKGTQMLFNQQIEDVNKSLTKGRAKSEDYKVGDSVRIKVPKGVLDKFAKFGEFNWSQRIYTIEKVTKPGGVRTAKYRIKGREETEIYSRNDLQPVNVNKLFKIDKARTITKPTKPNVTTREAKKKAETVEVRKGVRTRKKKGLGDGMIDPKGLKLAEKI